MVDLQTMGRSVNPVSELFDVGELHEMA
jgi:hypothetical protein